LIDIEQITPEQRREIITYLINNKGIKAKDLGIRPQYISMVMSGKAKVGEETFPSTQAPYLAHSTQT